MTSAAPDAGGAGRAESSRGANPKPNLSRIVQSYSRTERNGMERNGRREPERGSERRVVPGSSYPRRDDRIPLPRLASDEPPPHRPERSCAGRRGRATREVGVEERDAR